MPSCWWWFKCKDHGRPADMTIIGEFASVIKDVEASKGFLICSAGFAKTIHSYAKTLGIELLTIEALKSKWQTSVEIPIHYVQKVVGVSCEFAIVANAELVELNKESINLTPNDLRFLTIDRGATVVSFDDYIKRKLVLLSPSTSGAVDLIESGVMIQLAGIWVEMKDFLIHLSIEDVHYLKYVSPNEYSQINNHLTGKSLPLHFNVGVTSDLDSDYTKVDKIELPVFTNLSIRIEERVNFLGELTWSEGAMKIVSSHA